MEKREILSHRKKNRQIDDLVIYLVKQLISRNFCEKTVRENFCNFDTVATVWKNEKFTAKQIFFRQLNL